MKFATIEPKTATEALRYARTAEYASTLIEQGYEFELVGDCVLINKPGDLHFTYQIDRCGKCDCPDFVKHGNYCKHTLCYQEILENEEMWNAICAEEEARREREIFA